MKGEVISHFEVIDLLGEGGMGVVYKALDKNLDRIVALKLLPRSALTSETDRERFVVEAKSAASLNHPNICTVYEYDDNQGQALIAMEFVDGPTLADRMAEEKLTLEQALDITAQVALGLAAAHARGIVHRDIKPGNILLADGSVPKISDFGLAKIADLHLTQTGTTVGTVSYMSPEQAKGMVIGPETDVWSLGVVLFEMLAGKSPFPGEYPTAKLYSVVNTDPEGMEEIADEFGESVRQLLESMLSKDRDARPTAASVAEQLKPSGASGVVSLPPVVRARRRGSTRKLGLALGTLIVAIAGYAMITMVGEDPYGDLRSASIAMLPVASADSTLKITLDGLIEATSTAMTRVAEEQDAVRHFIPFHDVVEGGLESPLDLHEEMGAGFAIETIITGTDPLPTVEFSLVRAESGERLAQRNMAIATEDLHRSYLAALRHVSSLLGVTDTVLVASQAELDVMNPGAFSFYTRAKGVLQRDRSVANLDRAIQEYERALDVAPDDPHVLAGLGQVYQYRFEAQKDADDLEKAERLSDRAIEIDDELIEAYITLGAVHVLKGKPGQGRAVLELALAKEPFNTQALVELATVYEALDEYEQAETTLSRAIASKPAYVPGYRRLGWFYYEQSAYEKAAEQYRKIIELAPLNALGYRNLGTMHYMMDDLTTAQELWKQSLELEPSYGGFTNLGVLSYGLGDYPSAIDAYEQALRINDKDYRVWGNLASAHDALGTDPSKAREVKAKAAVMAEEWLEVNPRDDEAKSRLANYYAELGESDKARSILGEYEERPLDEISGLIAFELGAAWETLGERDIALEWIEVSISKGYSLTDIKSYPGLEELRQTPEFLRIMKSVSADSAG
jgi:serine/threonine-protein kinase